MSKQVKSVLVVAKPGHFWNGLQSLLRTVPQIEIIAETRDPSVLTRLDTEMRPELYLLDASLFDGGAWTALAKINRESAHTQCVVLVDDDKQQKSAQNAGADLVLSKGYPAAKLVSLIEELLSQKDNDS